MTNGVPIDARRKVSGVTAIIVQRKFAFVVKQATSSNGDTRGHILTRCLPLTRPAAHRDCPLVIYTTLRAATTWTSSSRDRPLIGLATLFCFTERSRTLSYETGVVSA